jgi:hypothetical protein
MDVILVEFFSDIWFYLGVTALVMLPLFLIASFAAYSMLAAIEKKEARAGAALPIPSPANTSNTWPLPLHRKLTRAMPSVARTLRRSRNRWIKRRAAKRTTDSADAAGGWRRAACGGRWAATTLMLEGCPRRWTLRSFSGTGSRSEFLRRARVVRARVSGRSLTAEPPSRRPTAEQAAGRAPEH